MSKWIIGIVAVLLFAAPAMAVSISCSPSEWNVIDVSYVATADPNVRAFALDVEVDAGVITEITYVNPGYWVYPGSIVIVDGEVNDPGTADANSTDFPPPGTLGGLGTSGVTVEMGSLYVGEANAPDDSGILFSFKVSDGCTITISENESRGGVVLEDATDATVDPALPTQCVAVECYEGPDYAAWDAVGKPGCWCYPRQCHGDGAGDVEGGTKAGLYYVGYNDLNLLLAAFKVLEPDKGLGIATVSTQYGAGICADFEHDVEGGTKAGLYYVGYNDLNTLLEAFKALEPPKNDPLHPFYPDGIPADCNEV